MGIWCHWANGNSSSGPRVPSQGRAAPLMCQLNLTGARVILDGGRAGGSGQGVWAGQEASWPGGGGVGMRSLGHIKASIPRLCYPDLGHAASLVNVPLPWRGFWILPTCTGYSIGLPTLLFQQKLGLCPPKYMLLFICAKYSQYVVNWQQEEIHKPYASEK